MAASDSTNLNPAGMLPPTNDFMKLNYSLCAAMALMPLASFAQSIIQAGSGSYASTPPAYKSKTDQHDGFNAGLMLSRKIYCDERDGRPIPTNDWWTDIINNRFSGALWSYPAMLHTSDSGVRIDYPSYWADEGKEIKSLSSVTVSALTFNPEAAIAIDWHDLDVTFRMPSVSNPDSEMRVTMAHGSPFTWFEYRNLTPMLSMMGDDISLFGENSAKGFIGIKIGNDLYGVYFTPGLKMTELNSSYIVQDARWVAVALLRDESDLERFAVYATGIIRDSRISWNFDQTNSRLNSEWQISTEHLDHPGERVPSMLGLLPHVYKYSSTLPSELGGSPYNTPRGEMRMYVSDSGSYKYDYTFSGMMPYYAYPEENPSSESGFSHEVLQTLMKDYAERGGFGADTYWGGKGLVQMALNMTFAKMSGDEEIYNQSRARLKDAFVNWLTYTPGEDSMFFSYYPRWGSMLGFNVSYDSDAFNDHHFHYGYFTYAAALLCMEDPEFASEYGDILKLIAKDYANYDREDTRFPFLRTLDPWCGHSWAGGLGDAGNDNGNGQESSSEAMQSWGGLYLLGVALNDKEMRDAGIWGWNTEARATREYWYDVDAPRPANAGGRQPWAGKGEKKGNYDYSQYKYAYNSNITGKGIGWWTWFGGDPLFMHGIQWMPVSPALDYLSWDNDFVGWAFDDMMSGANSTFSHDWFLPTYNSDNGEEIEPLANNDWGNVALAYMQRSRPEEAASIFARALKEQRHIATAVSTGHISYYLIHHHLTYGDIDFDVTADIPTASAYLKNGIYTYMVYNPEDQERTVNFRKNGQVVKSVLAPARKLTAFSLPAEAATISLSSEEGAIVAPGGKTKLNAVVLDQYGASFADAEKITLSTSAQGVEISSDGTLSVNENVVKGTKFAVNAVSGKLSATIELTVNDPAIIERYEVEGLPEFAEKGSQLNFSLRAFDQYGEMTQPDVAEWRLESESGEVSEIKTPYIANHSGRFTLKAYLKNNPEKPAYEGSLVILPVLPDLSLAATAIASSEENVGTSIKNINDGDRGSRWGSRHNDDEWVVLDLGEDCFITCVTPDWEAAYGADYDYQIAPDGCPLEEAAGAVGGISGKIMLPSEDSWEIVAEVRGNSSVGQVPTRMSAKGRYLRLRGLHRGSAYGYSIHEMEVRGFKVATPEDTPVGIDFGMPAVTDQGVSVPLSPVAYNKEGKGMSVNVKWGADKQARFAGNNFIPVVYGIYTVTARTDDGFSSSETIFVNEGTRIASISLTPDKVSSIVNEAKDIELSLVNQFGGIVPFDSDVVNVKIIDKATGKPADSAYTTYDPETGVFYSTKRGEYVINVNDGAAKAEVSVLNVSEANLALGRPVSTTSAENGGLTGNFAVDGDPSTRWGSLFKDEQSMTVDLGNIYSLTEIVIYWDEIAFATDYSVESSRDGIDFYPIFSRTGWRGEPVGNDCRKDDYHISNKTYARYVRLTGHKRSTGYGTSIREFEVYADDDLSQTVGVDLGISSESAYADSGIYNLQGIKVREHSSDIHTLPAGLYIINGKLIGIR